MNKIVIIGSPGAGKSTLAQALSKVLDVEVIHLDRLFWRAGWKELPREERIKIQQELVSKKDWWIMEGTYLSSSEERINAADTIIFLDLPRLLCLWRIIKRHVTTYNQPLLDLPDGCTDKLSLFCILKVLVFPQRGRRQLMKKIAMIRKDAAGQPAQKTILALRFQGGRERSLLAISLYKQKAPLLTRRSTYRNMR